MCSKPVARFEATCPLLTTGVEADLVSLGRVNTLETNLGCTNGEGIAVNNSGGMPTNSAAFALLAMSTIAVSAAKHNRILASDLDGIERQSLCMPSHNYQLR
jgi:hypothetical protein